LEGETRGERKQSFKIDSIVWKSLGIAGGVKRIFMALK